MTVSGKAAAEAFAPAGSVLEIRDETWLVLRSERATDGWFVEVQGLSELVRGTQATFSTALDRITPLDPSEATVRVDMSPGSSSRGSGSRRPCARPRCR